ncbi:MAG: sigma-70 family RNA polymerase sigma factor [Candidatus Aminicenantales bacterium]
MKKNKISAEEFEALLDRFSGRIRESVLRHGLESRGIDPDDVIQDVKIKIWKKLVREKKTRFHSLYIKRAVNSVLIDHLRSVRRQERVILRAGQRIRPGEGKNPEFPDEGNGYWELVNEAVSSLMEPRRQVVTLFLMDLTADEISSVLKWSQDKTRNLLYRGLSDLREKLKEGGVEYENRH